MTHDDVVRGALSDDDLRLYDALGRRRNPMQLAFETLRGEDRGFALAAWVAGFLFFALAVYAGTRFAAAPDVRGMANWGGLAALAIFSLGLIKLWFWSEIQKLAVMRALKRMELQVSAITRR